MRLKRSLPMILGCFLIVSASASAQEGQRYLMVTGGTGTKPYNVGIALESLINLKLAPKTGIHLNTEASASYAENLLSIGKQRSQFTIADSVSTHAAVSGQGIFQDLEYDRDLRGVAVLWHEVDHFLVSSDRALSGTIADLVPLIDDGIATDPANRHATYALLKAFDPEFVDDSLLPSFNMLGQLDAFTNGAVAALAVTRTSQSGDVPEITDSLGNLVQPLEFTGRQLAQLGNGWQRQSLPAGTYRAVNDDIDTVARSVMLLTSASVDEDVVYQMTRTMFENLPFLTAIDDTAGLIAQRHALEGMNVPLHPGAARFFNEVGHLPEESASRDNALLTVAAASAEPAVSGTKMTNPEATTRLPSEPLHDMIAKLAPGQSTDDPKNADTLPSFTLDDEMLNRSRAEIHDGAEVLKIDRPEELNRPGVEIASIYFKIAKTEPSSENAAKIRNVAQRILEIYKTSKKIPEIYVEGHTDSTGDWKINYEIAYRRAQSIKNAIISFGVPADWIQVSDHSEEKLAVPTGDGVGNWRNRRVEVIIIPSSEA